MNILKLDGSLLMIIIMTTTGINFISIALFIRKNATQSAFNKNFWNAKQYAKIMTNRKKLKPINFKKFNK